MSFALHGQRSPTDPVLLYRNDAVVSRIQAKEALARDEAETLFSDLLRFLYLCGRSSHACAPTARIDAAWHHFILFTRDYRDFCRTYFGRFIDHLPAVEGDSEDRQILRDTVRAAEEKFGPLSDNWDQGEAFYCKTLNCRDGCRGTSDPDDDRGENATP